MMLTLHFEDRILNQRPIWHIRLFILVQLVWQLLILVFSQRLRHRYRRIYISQLDQEERSGPPRGWRGRRSGRFGRLGAVVMGAW